MKQLMISCALVLALFTATAQNSYTLKQCIETALANNLQVKQQDLARQNASSNFDQSRYNRLPQLSAGMGYGINNGRSIDPFTNGYITQQLNSSNANAQLQVPVFNGLKIMHSIRQNENALKAAELDLQQEKDNLTLNIILNYLQVLNNEDLLALAEKQAAVTKAQVDRMDVLNKEGAVAPSELTDLKGQYASEQINVMNARVSLETSRLALTQLMNIPYVKGISLSREGSSMEALSTDLTAEAIYQKALQQLAIVKANQFRQQSAGNAVKVVEADRYPTISLFGQLSTNYSSAATRNTLLGTSDVANGDYVTVNSTKIPVFSTVSNYSSHKISFGNQFSNNVGTYAGVSLNLPLFTAFQTRTRIRQAKLVQQNTIVQGDILKNQLRQNIETAWMNCTNAWDRFNTLKEQVAAFEESYRAAEARFNEGAWNSVQYLIVKNNLDRAKANLVIAGYEFQLRNRILDFYQGLQKW